MNIPEEHPRACYPGAASPGQGRTASQSHDHQCITQNPYPSQTFSKFPHPQQMLPAILDSPPVYDVPLLSHAPLTPPHTLYMNPAELPQEESPLTALEFGEQSDLWTNSGMCWGDKRVQSPYSDSRRLNDLDFDILGSPPSSSSTLMGSIDADGWYTPPSHPWEGADNEWHLEQPTRYAPLCLLSPLDEIPHHYSSVYHQDVHRSPPFHSPSSSTSSYLRSPSLGSLPDLEDDLGFDFESPPCSPSSLRSTSSLPDDEDEGGMDFSCAMDSEVDLGIPYYARNLLLVDDDEDGAPSSPASIASSSLEAEFEAELEQSTDPIVIQLCAIRSRAMAAERAARYAESISVGCAAAQARRVRKSEKAKRKEVGTWLRLKMLPGYEDEHSLTSSPEWPVCEDLPGRGEALASKAKKGESTSIAELVAKMLFRRHDVVRPLTNRSSPLSPKPPRTPSALSKAIAID